MCIAADPAQAPEVRGRRGGAIAARKRALRAWEQANPNTSYDPECFRRDILPQLKTVKLSEIAEAARCSKASASDIRREKWTPHVSTWVALVATGAPLCHGELSTLRRGEPCVESAIDAVLSAPGVDPLFADPEIERDVSDLASGCDKIQHSLAEPCRIPSSSLACPPIGTATSESSYPTL
ncbi:MAG: hypothetical protein WAV54_03860 [Acidimicrobiales bacterium]